MHYRPRPKDRTATAARRPRGQRMKVLPPSRYFPPVELADEDGLLAIGGSLSSDWLLDAYQHAIFPWPLGDELLAWWSPDPRAILEFDEFHVPRRLARTVRSGKYAVTFNRAFDDVIDGCRTAPGRRGATWITQAMARAYKMLHRLGHAHSAEAWYESELAGGVYGVSIAGLFAAESMFCRRSDASKVALYHLLQRLKQRGYALVDLQILNAHTRWLGGREIPRHQYLRRLAEALTKRVSFDPDLPRGAPAP